MLASNFPPDKTCNKQNSFFCESFLACKMVAILHMTSISTQYKWKTIKWFSQLSEMVARSHPCFKFNAKKFHSEIALVARTT